MDTHTRLASTFFIALGILGMIGGVIAFVAIAGGGLISGDPEAMVITATVASVVSAIIFLFSVPPVIGGIAMLNGRSWAPTFLMIVAAMQLLVVPFGTILGIYALWALSPRQQPQPPSMLPSVS